jgi:hypothetical protein
LIKIKFLIPALQLSSGHSAKRAGENNGASFMSVQDECDRNRDLSRRNILLAGTTLAAASAIVGTSAVAQAQQQPAAPSGRKPNILMIMSDDIGWFKVGAYNMGIMGYRTPNIDRIGREGAIFTDYYGEQSCTAGRAAFITGQSPINRGFFWS